LLAIHAPVLFRDLEDTDIGRHLAEREDQHIGWRSCIKARIPLKSTAAKRMRIAIDGLCRRSCRKLRTHIDATHGSDALKSGALQKASTRPSRRKTGFWLEELAAPYYVFEDAGAPLSPKSPINGTR
jgi:hypothetical protein